MGTISRRLFLNFVFGLVTALPALAEFKMPTDEREPLRPIPEVPITLTAGPLSPERRKWPAFNELAFMREAAALLGCDPQVAEMEYRGWQERTQAWLDSKVVYEGGAYTLGE